MSRPGGGPVKPFSWGRENGPELCIPTVSGVIPSPTWSLGVPVRRYCEAMTMRVYEPPAESWRRITRKPRLFLGCRLIVALWDGGKTAAELAAITGRPVLAMWAALRSMEAYGKVRRDGDLWRLV